MAATEKIPLPYRIAAALIRLMLKVYFRSIEVVGREQIPQKGPAILASNHPNSTIDPFVVGNLAGRKVNFLAMSSFFERRAIAWFLSRCGVILIHRRQDDPTKMDQNVSSFEAVLRALEKREAIGIFPEGVTHDDLKVRKIKTGAARMSLEAEAKYHFRLGVQVVPIGLNYMDKTRFRSDLLINVGEPMEAKPYEEAYRRDPQAAVKAMTEELQHRMEALIVNLEEPGLKQLQQALEEIYLDRVREVATAGGGQRGIAEDFTWRKMIADCVNYYARHDPDRVRAVGSQVQRYYRVARRLRFNDELLTQQPSQAVRWTTWVRMAVLGMLGLPIAVYGTMNSYIPYRLAKLVGQRNPYYRYYADKTKISIYSLLAGTIAFLVFYPIQGFLVWSAFGNPEATLYLLSLPPSGFFALWYAERAKEYRRSLFYAWLQRKNRHLLPLLKKRRDEVLATLDAVRMSYDREVRHLNTPARDGGRIPALKGALPPEEG
ncbi:MAG TPA: lysophospholipid acyltransferase family protein [Candidatus Methylomirabilis sp.]|nr:lysophospholipid acyltransferase family protein [Candidatus Methylomirabilis sp.]